MRSFLVLSFFSLVACAKTVEPAAPAPEPAPAPAPAPAVKAPIIEAVYFETGKSSVSDAQIKVVDEAAEIMRSSNWKVIVLGLADATGDAQANRALSMERAENVAALLRAKAQVGSDRVLVQAIGERLATGATVSERKVEFVFYEERGLTPREVVMQSGVLDADFRKKAAAQ